MSDAFQELLDALADRTISDEQFARLEQLINEDAGLRMRFLDYQHLCAGLEEQAIREDSSRAALTLEDTLNSEERIGSPSGVQQPSVPDSDNSPQRPAWRNAFSMIAVLLAGLMLGGPLGWMLNEQAAVETPADAGPKEDVVATLSFVSDDVVWSDGHGAVRLPGDGLDKGWMRLDAGVIEMKFASGATVRIEGPAAFGVDSPLRSFLEFGMVSVHAPEEARDFVVGTAAMEVVDLGTRFTMTIDRESGEADVKVVEGLVDLHLEGDGTSNRIQSLPAGQSAKVNARGEVVRIDGKAIDPRHRDASGLLAHWKLDDIGDDGHVTDDSGNELHGTLNGNTRARSREGKVGRSLELGLQGYVDLSAHIPVLTSTSAYTLTAWVRDADDIVFSMSDGTPRDRVQFELHGQWLYYGWQEGDVFDHIRARVSDWERGRWYQVAVSVSGGSVTIYRDGQALIKPHSYGEWLGTRARAPIDVDHPTHAHLGFLVSNHVHQEQFLGGQLDDVQFYGRALDEQAIKFLFENPGAIYSERLSP